MQRKYGTYFRFISQSDDMIDKELRIETAEECRAYISFSVNGKASERRAFLISDTVKIEIKTERFLDVRNVFVNLYDESESAILEKYYLSFLDYDNVHDIFVFKLPIKKIGVGLYFFEVGLVSGIYGELSASICDNSYKFANITRQKIQFSITDFKYKANESFLGTVIYHIFVDRFYRGKNKKDTKDIPWESEIPEYPKYPGEPIKNEYIYGGTIKGIIEKLGYLCSLGVGIIYLSPIFEARSNHKYDTADYNKIDSRFGTEKDLCELVSKASELGIGIILDGVFNHTGSDSIYFNKYGRYSELGAYQSRESKYFSWYEFEKFPERYTCWWGIDILPRINTNKEECANFFVGQDGIISKYRRLGILGFRLDVVDELSDEFIEKIKDSLESLKEGSLLYGEVWEDASNKIAYGKRKRYYLGKELDGVMNYPLREGIISFLKKSEKGRLLYALCDIMNNTPKRILDMQMNLLGSHDTERIITALGGEDAFEKSNEYLLKARICEKDYQSAEKKLMLAYTLIATLPGLPCIYYADEVGLEGYSDPFNRRPFPWGRENKNIFNHYKKIGEIRKRNPVYRKGEFRLLHFENQVLIFERYTAKYSYLTVINNSNGAVLLSFENNAVSLLSNICGVDFIISSQSSEIFKVSKTGVFIFQQRKT